MSLFYVSDEMLQMVANGEELNLPDEISINDIAEFSASKLIEARQRIRELEEHQRWIPVSERLPGVGCPVLCGTTKYSFVSKFNLWIGDNGDKYWQNSQGIPYHFDIVTHWRPLPTPPEEE